MYETKRQRNRGFKFFTSAIADSLSQRLKIKNGLKLALEMDAFSLTYMPIYHCETLQIVGAEALLRVAHPLLDGIGPDVFIPVAEKTGLIKDIDLWVLDNSLKDLKELQNDFGFKGLVCINISGVELRNEDFPQQVEALLKKYDITASSVELEITETSLVVDNQKGQAILHQLKSLGVSLALDDFGTGYTAFSQLVNYPVDCLKIDKSFVTDLFSDDHARTKMVRIIQELANIYSLRVVGEGVETKEQLEYIQKNGCNWIQGYLLSRPIPKAKLVELLVGETDALV